MQPTIKRIAKIPWIRIIDMKPCHTKCKCINKLKMLEIKTPVNIIDETFIKFKIKTIKEKYNKCYSLKIGYNIEKLDDIM